ncbi:5430_t:CDS:2, partial [Funneliformis geosporum]
MTQKAMTSMATAQKAMMVDQTVCDLTKLIKIGQNNSIKLKSVVQSQERLEVMLIEQNGYIATIMSKLEKLDILNIISTEVK